MKINKVIFCLVVVVLITGCSAQTGKKEIMDSISKIEYGLKQSDFSSLKLEVKELEKRYNKHEWKIHLLGDEGEYERLNETINRLIAAIEAEELVDAQLELATIKTIVKDIYSL